MSNDERQGKTIYDMVGSKTCIKCGKTKSLTDFYKATNCNDGFRGNCKVCIKEYGVSNREDRRKYGTSYRESNRYRIREYRKEYRRSFKGKIWSIYQGMKKRSKRRSHPQPNFSLRDFKAWLIVNGYQDMYKIWKESDYNSGLAPSPDRLKNNKPYTFDNMELVPWHINNKRN